MTKAEILKLLENYDDDADFPGLNFPGDVPFDKVIEEELAKDTRKKESDYKDDLKDLADKAGGTFNPEGVEVKKPTSVDEVPEQAKDLYRKMHVDNAVSELEAEAKNIADGYTDSVLFDKDENGNIIKPDDFHRSKKDISGKVLSFNELPKEEQDKWFNTAMQYKSEWAEDSDEDVRKLAEYDARDIAETLYENKLNEDSFADLKTVYTTSDDTGLVWKDPTAFKKFVIGNLIAGLPKEEREEALEYYWKFTPEELIKHHDTAGALESFDATAKDDSGATIFDPYNKDLTWDASLKDLYNTGDDTDPFDKDLYDLLDNFNGEIIDANGDGDPDVTVEGDTATVVADDPKEAKDGVKAAKESLAGSFAEGNDLFNTFDKATSKDKLEQDSTGSLNDKPQEEASDIRKKRIEKMSNNWGATNTQKKKADCAVSDEKEKDKKHPADCSCSECKKSKDQELSDFRFKNILGALQDKLW